MTLGDISCGSYEKGLILITMVAFLDPPLSLSAIELDDDDEYLARTVQTTRAPGAPLGSSTPLQVCILNLRNYKRLPQNRLSKDPTTFQSYTERHLLLSK